MTVIKLATVLFVILLVLLGLGHSLGIVVPAPIFALLPLSVGAPEISPWLIVWNGLALFGGLGLFKVFPARSVLPWWILGLIGLSAIALTLSSIPLRQFGPVQQDAQQRMVQILGADY